MTFVFTNRCLTQRPTIPRSCALVDVEKYLATFYLSTLNHTQSSRMIHIHGPSCPPPPPNTVFQWNTHICNIRTTVRHRKLLLVDVMGWMNPNKIIIHRCLLKYMYMYLTLLNVFWEVLLLTFTCSLYIIVVLINGILNSYNIVSLLHWTATSSSNPDVTWNNKQNH